MYSKENQGKYHLTAIFIIPLNLVVLLLETPLVLKILTPLLSMLILRKIFKK